MQALERLLFIWALRHPASGYVQGINDLATPFLTVFLGAFGTGTGGEDAGAALDDIDPATMDDVEADAYWCVSRLLDSIQDNYTFGQPGIQRLLHSLEDLVRRTDGMCRCHLFFFLLLLFFFFFWLVFGLGGFFFNCLHVPAPVALFSFGCFHSVAPMLPPFVSGAVLVSR